MIVSRMTLVVMKRKRRKRKLRKKYWKLKVDFCEDFKERLRAREVFVCDLARKRLVRALVDGMTKYWGV